MFSVPNKTIKLTFLERVGRTGASEPLLFMATDGKRKRGVRILLADVLLWSLKPKPTEEQLPLVAAQLGRTHVATTIADVGVDAFFAAHGDLDIPVRSDNSPTTWDPEQPVD